MPSLAPGDIVRCRSTDYARDLGVAERVGVVLEPRSAHCLVFFAEDDACFWIPGRGLDGATPTQSRSQRELELLRDLLYLFGATEVEIEDTSAEGLTLNINHAALSLATIEAIGERIGPALTSMEVQPGGMAFMTTALALDRQRIGSNGS